MEPKRVDPQSFPLVQRRQADLLEACGFPCAPAGKHLFFGQMIPMWRATGERRAPKAGAVGYGGAAFGGKSYGALILARVAAELFPGVQIAYFRRTYTQLDGPGASIQKAYEVFGNAAEDRDGGKEWKFPNGSVFYFRHCQHEKDVYDYQSQQIDILLMDEATHFTWMIVDYLLTRNRASGGVKITGFKPFAVLFTNPGNIGHAWYLKLFDMENEHGPHETVKESINPNGKKTQVYFLGAKLEDNAVGVAADPDYEGRLSERSKEIAEALRDGNWKIFAGQRFPTWIKERMVCKSFEIPGHWAKWRAMDYGYVHPMVAGWFTRNPETGRIYCYRAVLATEISDEGQARLISDMTPAGERITVTYASPDMWSRSAKIKTNSTSADVFKDNGVILTRADNDRIGGARKIDRLLKDAPSDDGKTLAPMFQIFEEYYEVFKVFETLVREDATLGADAEDVKKVLGDDPYDMTRYALTNTKLPEKKDGSASKKVHPARGMKL